MAGDPLALVYDFEADLTRFGDEVEQGAERVFRAAARTTAEAITVGNTYGPGVPVDTGWARSSIAAGLNAPAATRGERPWTSRKINPAGRLLFPEVLDATVLLQATLGDTVYITTIAAYPQHLEFTPKRRRFGVNAGASTEFLGPVEARFEAIVDDAAHHVGYGSPG